MIMYIKNTAEGIYIKKEKKEECLNISSNRYLNNLCLKELTTLKGRTEAIKKVLNIRSKIPIYINQGVILFPTVSSRRNDCIWINNNYILSISVKNNKSIVIFKNFDYIMLDVDYSKLIKQQKKSFLIKEFMQKDSKDKKKMLT